MEPASWRARSIPLPIATLAGTLVETAYRLSGTEKEPPLTRFVAEQLGTSHWFDLTAAKRDLGYAAPVSTAEGLRLLVTDAAERAAPQVKF